MKPSIYTKIINSGERSIVFNCLTQAFFEIPQERAETYRAILEEPDKYAEEFYAFLERMRGQGFVVEDDTDEKALAKQKYESARRPGHYFLMILPTYQCNLRCWYCTQDHADLWMGPEVVELVKRRIEHKLADPDVKHLHLAWFGGEPLLAYDVVLELTNFARQEAEKHGKTFDCDITSNSTLLTPERIEELRKAGVVSYQITIDGTKDVHDKIKVLGKRSAFETALANINRIAKHTFVNLRFNYTHENLDPDGIAADIESRLDSENRKNISLNLYKVWQENQESVKKEDVDRLFSLAREAGFSSRKAMPGICYVDQYHYDCIYPDGSVGKCDNSHPDEAQGMLMDDGTVKWDEEKVEKFLPVFFTDVVKTECEGCTYFPFCFGPCAVKRDHMWRNTGKVGCQYPNKVSEMNQSIINYVANIKK